MLTSVAALPSGQPTPPQAGRSVHQGSPKHQPNSAFRSRLCSAPLGRAADSPQLLRPRADLDMLLQKLGECQRMSDRRSRRANAERSEVEALKADAAYQSYSVCALLIESARYQRDRGSTSLNAHIHRVAMLGPGAGGAAVPAATLRVIMNDCAIIRQQCGFPKVLQAVCKLPLWEIS